MWPIWGILCLSNYQNLSLWQKRAVARESITSAPIQPSKTDIDGLKEAQSPDHAAKISNKEVGRVEGNAKVAIATRIENKESTAVLPPLKRQKTEDYSEESGLPAN